MADGVTLALVKDTEGMVSAMDGAVARQLGHASLFVSGIPIPFLNGVTTVRATASAEHAASLLDEVAAHGVPYSLQLRPGSTSALPDLARARGMVEDVRVPLMAMDGDVADLTKAAEHPTLATRTVSSDEWRFLAALAAEGFEEPVDVFERFVPRAAWALPGFRAYIGSVAGEPVTTALGSTDGDYVGIFDVATPRRHRGCGYASAITARAVLDGFESGASVAYLQSSAMALKVYERLGFRTLEMWSVWITPGLRER